MSESHKDATLTTITHFFPLASACREVSSPSIFFALRDHSDLVEDMSTDSTIILIYF